MLDRPDRDLRLYELTFDGGILQRGFWLYVWEIIHPSGDRLYYVGRTGDSSSTNAQSPFNRMGQHLGFVETSCMLRRHLRTHHVEPEACTFRLVSVGPLEAESRAEGRAEHDERRDRVAALERALAEALHGAGCQVMNTVRSRKQLNADDFNLVKQAFRSAFPFLRP